MPPIVAPRSAPPAFRALIRLKRIYNFWCFMLIYTPFALCFIYTSWRFYAFSGTNLLTRRHSASSCFLLFCVSEKSHRKYFRNWTKQKLKSLITWHEDGVQRRAEDRPRGGHTWWWRGPPLGRATRGCDLLVHLLTSPFHLFNPLDGKILRAWTLFQKTYYKPPSSSTRDREGPEALPNTLPERGITTGGLLHHHACLRSDVWVIYLRLRVHSSS
jgi:hypothetical protein